MEALCTQIVTDYEETKKETEKAFNLFLRAFFSEGKRIYSKMYAIEPFYNKAKSILNNSNTSEADEINFLIFIIKMDEKYNKYGTVDYYFSRYLYSKKYKNQAEDILNTKIMSKEFDKIEIRNGE